MNYITQALDALITETVLDVQQNLAENYNVEPIQVDISMGRFLYWVIHVENAEVHDAERTVVRVNLRGSGERLQDAIDDVGRDVAVKFYANAQAKAKKTSRKSKKKVAK